MPTLKALGKHHFTLAGQQRNGTHFAKVQANRITRLLDRSRCQVEFTVLDWKPLFQLYDAEIGDLCDIASPLGTIGIFVDTDTVAIKGGKHFINLFGGMHFGRQNVIYLIVQQITALLANSDKMAYLNVLFLDRKSQAFLRCQAVLAAESKGITGL